jgi:hypothetical protein
LASASSSPRTLALAGAAFAVAAVSIVPALRRRRRRPCSRGCAHGARFLWR